MYVKHWRDIILLGHNHYSFEARKLNKRFCLEVCEDLNYLFIMEVTRKSENEKSYFLMTGVPMLEEKKFKKCVGGLKKWVDRSMVSQFYIDTNYPPQIWSNWGLCVKSCWDFKSDDYIGRHWWKKKWQNFWSRSATLSLQCISSR